MLRKIFLTPLRAAMIIIALVSTPVGLVGQSSALVIDQPFQCSKPKLDMSVEAGQELSTSGSNSVPLLDISELVWQCYQQSQCASHEPAKKTGEKNPSSVKQTGWASWYGPGFQGKETKSGIAYDMHKPYAASKTLPMGTEIKVTNAKTKRSVKLTVVDLMPKSHQKKSKKKVTKIAAQKGSVRPYIPLEIRIADLSHFAFKRLGGNPEKDGLMYVTIEVTGIRSN